MNIHMSDITARISKYWVELLWKDNAQLGSTQPPIQWVQVALSSGVKQRGREADHTSPASDEVKEMWIDTSTPPYTFMA
jgi:hypothetical protein